MHCIVKQKLRTNFNSTIMDDNVEISMIESPRRDKFKSPRAGMKPPQNTPQTNYKTAANDKNVCVPEPSPSVLVRKRPSPKSNKKNLATPKTPKATKVTPAKSSSSRPQRSVQRKRIIYSDDDESDKENSASDWTDSSYSGSDAGSALLTDDDSDKERDIVGEPKSARGKKAPTGSTTKRQNKKANKNDLIYLDLSSEEVVEVDENFHSNVPEDDLANITRKFLEADLNAVDE